MYKAMWFVGECKSYAENYMDIVERTMGELNEWLKKHPVEVVSIAPEFPPARDLVSRTFRVIVIYKA